jgi:hypothetical protein
MNHLSPFPSFTRAESARLSIYKAAVAGGLYSDVISDESGSSYGFSSAELTRLVTYRAAVAAGLFTDQLDAASETSLGG